MRCTAAVGDAQLPRSWQSGGRRGAVTLERRSPRCTPIPPRRPISPSLPCTPHGSSARRRSPTTGGLPGTSVDGPRVTEIAGAEDHGDRFRPVDAALAFTSILASAAPAAIAASRSPVTTFMATVMAAMAEEGLTVLPSSHGLSRAGRPAALRWWPPSRSRTPHRGPPRLGRCGGGLQPRRRSQQPRVTPRAES
jgi:hypothetical protein